MKLHLSLFLPRLSISFRNFCSPEMARIKGRRYLFGVILSIHVASKYLEIISFLGVFSLWRFLRARSCYPLQYPQGLAQVVARRTSDLRDPSSNPGEAGKSGPQKLAGRLATPVTLLMGAKLSGMIAKQQFSPPVSAYDISPSLAWT